MNGDDSQEGQAIVSKKSLKQARGANHDYVQEIERSGNANNILGIIWLNVIDYFFSRVTILVNYSNIWYWVLVNTSVVCSDCNGCFYAETTNSNLDSCVEYDPNENDGPQQATNCRKKGGVECYGNVSVEIRSTWLNHDLLQCYFIQHDHW